MSVLNVVANLIFIPRFGIVGVAMATLFAMTLYNMMKMGYVYHKFKMQPFTSKTIWIILIAIICYLVGVYFPSSGIPILDIIIRSSIIGVIYGLAVYYFEISKEINEMLHGILERMNLRGK